MKKHLFGITVLNMCVLPLDRLILRTEIPRKVRWAPWQRRGFFKTARLGGEDALTLFLKQTSPVDRKRRENPMDCFNSKLRAVQYIKKHVNQEYLWLLALKHNIEPFAHGKRKGYSPFELLGIDWGTNDWVDLVLTYQP